MIEIFTRAYHGIYYEHTGSRIVRVIQLNGETKILGEKTDWFCGKDSIRLNDRSFCDDLALAILRDAFGNVAANSLWQEFSIGVVRQLPKENWIITKEQIADLYAAKLVLVTLGEMGGKAGKR